MFEKEAEEYAIENWEYYEEGKNDSKALKQAYLAGAEFGYNKANEWIAEEQLQNVELEEEKCELLGLIQAKDKLIKKMKNCGNCKWCSNQCCIENFENPISYRGCENYSKWELAE